MCDRLLQHSRRILGIIFPVGFVCFRESVSRVIGFLEAARLDCCRFLERLPCFAPGFLQSEGVGCLRVEIDGVFVFFCLAAKEREAAAGGGVRFLSLLPKLSAMDPAIAIESHDGGAMVVATF